MQRRSPAREALVVFVVALLVTGLLVASVAAVIRRQERLAFEHEVSRTLEDIGGRVAITSNLLRGAAGLFAASEDVSADEFRRYVASLRLRERYPGILGLGYTRQLAPAEVESFEAEVRASGRPDFRIWPRTPRAEYHAIVYLEPLDRRNAAAIGYDMFTEPVRRAAMKAARARGDLVASGKVTLVQEIDRHKQAGFLLYLPVQERRAGPLVERGFVYAPLRVDDLLAGTRGPASYRVDYEVFDGRRATRETLLRTTLEAPGRRARLTTERVIDVAGRPWLVRFHGRRELDALSRSWLVPWLALTALVASALLARLSWTQGRARRAAEAAAAAQRLAAQHLHREREWLGATLTSIGDGVVAVDADHRVTWINPVAERLTGWPRDEAMGRSLDEVVQARPLDEGGAGESLPGETGRGAVLLVGRDGTTRPVDHSSAPIRDPHGAMSGAVIVMRDASERHRVEAELRENDRRKDEFLAMLAHELRNPLAPISTAAALLRMPGLDAAQVQQASAVISRQVRHMTDLVDDLLDVSRVTRGLVAFEKSVFDLREAVAAAVEQVRPLVEGAGHRLRCDTGDAPLWVYGDRTRLTQVVTNLLDNAVKYTPRGGNIAVDASGAERCIRLSVSDDGQGIAADLRPRVFELFTQGLRALDRAQGGLGIGLALVRSVVDQHGGNVRVESDGPGHGSLFVVELPAAEPPQPAPPGDDAPAAPPGRALDVAVVDDNHDALQTTARLLQAHGHRVRTFPTAEHALQAAHDAPAEIYILDIGLPGMSGHDLARQLRAHPRTAGAVLLALSGYGQQADIASSRAAGFQEHFTKPVDPERLLRVLQRIAGRPAQAD